MTPDLIEPWEGVTSEATQGGVSLRPIVAEDRPEGLEQSAARSCRERAECDMATTQERRLDALRWSSNHRETGRWVHLGNPG